MGSHIDVTYSTLRRTPGWIAKLRKKSTSDLWGSTIVVVHWKLWVCVSSLGNCKKRLQKKGPIFSLQNSVIKGFQGWLGNLGTSPTERSHSFSTFSSSFIRMGVEPKIGVGPPNHPFVHRVFQYKPPILGVFPLFLETPECCTKPKPIIRNFQRVSRMWRRIIPPSCFGTFPTSTPGRCWLISCLVFLISKRRSGPEWTPGRSHWKTPWIPWNVPMNPMKCTANPHESHEMYPSLESHGFFRTHGKLKKLGDIFKTHIFIPCEVVESSSWISSISWMFQVPGISHDGGDRDLGEKEAGCWSDEHMSSAGMAIFDAKMMCKEATKSGLLGGSSMICKWLITMVIVSPLRIGLWDPFHMAELYGL